MFLSLEIIFLGAPTAIKHQPNGLLKNCRYLGDFQLDEQDTKTLKAMYPDFAFKYLTKYVRLPQIHDAMNLIQMICF